jgi:hypothetical protein
MISTVGIVPSTHYLTDKGGQDWTLAVVRANQWQTWRWLARLDDLAERDGSGSALPLLLTALQIPAVAPAFASWLSYKLRRRRDCLVTIRPGVRSTGAARRGAVFEKHVPDPQAAMQLVAHLGQELGNGSLSFNG